MNTRTWPKRLYALDVSRGLAALAVVLWHWQHFAYSGDQLDSNFVRSDQPLYLPFKMFYERGASGVTYFFILSGFIFFWLYHDRIASGKITFSRYWVDRFSRLYPLHLFTLLLVGAQQQLLGALGEKQWVYPANDIFHFVLNLGFVQAWGLSRAGSFNAPTWSVSAEIFLYLVFLLMARARLGKASSCLIIAVLAAPGALAPGRDMITGQGPILQGLSAFFLGGAAFYGTRYITERRPVTAQVVHGLVMIAWIAVLVQFYIFDIASVFRGMGPLGRIALSLFPGWFLFPGTICSLALAEIGSSPATKDRLSRISWVGDITYSSYLLHFPLQLMCVLAISKGLLDPDFYQWKISVLLFFTVLVPLSYATFVGFERPAQAWIRARLPRNRRSGNKAAEASRLGQMRSPH